jgi:ribosomal protein L11 methylase PrmA
MPRILSLFLASLIGLALLTGTALTQADKPTAVKAGDDKKVAQKDKDREPDVIYVPTPQEAVEEMLKMAKVSKNDVVWDLGCGDARIPVTAAKKYGCKARGFDIDPERIKDSQENVKKNDVGKLVTIEKKDIFTLDLSKEPTVVTLYLLPELNVKLLPQLRKLPKGARVVSHAFMMGDIKPDEEKSVKTDRGEVSIYLWKVETLQAAKK